MNALFQDLQAEVSAALVPLTASQTQRRPAQSEGKWSIQQIVEHLLVTYRATCSAFEDRISKRRLTLTTATTWQTLQQVWVISWGHFPAYSSAPAAYLPVTVMSLRSGPELMFRVHADLIRMSALAEKAESLFGTRKAVVHPTLGPLSIAQWRRYHVLHGRHHLAQIRRIREQI